MARTANYLALFLISLLIAWSCGRTSDEDSLAMAQKANKKKFEDRNKRAEANAIAELVAVNFAEVTLAQLAEERSSNPDLKAVAGSIRTDKDQVLGDLHAIAMQKGVYIPTREPVSLKKKIAGLAAVENNARFDEDWCEIMLSRNEDQIRLMEKAMSQSDDTEFKQWMLAKVQELKQQSNRISNCDLRASRL